jgi:hypothetical protein
MPRSRRVPDPKRLLRVTGATATTCECHRGVPAGIDDLRYRRVGLGQVDAGQRHALSRGRAQLNHASTGTAHFERIEGLEHSTA